MSDDHTWREVETSGGFRFMAKLAPDCSQRTIDALGNALKRLTPERLKALKERILEPESVDVETLDE